MKLNFIDVHCHIEMIELTLEEIIENANKSGVSIILTQGVNPESNRKSLEISNRYNIVKSESL